MQDVAYAADHLLLANAVKCNQTAQTDTCLYCMIQLWFTSRAQRWFFVSRRCRVWTEGKTEWFSPRWLRCPVFKQQWFCSVVCCFSWTHNWSTVFQVCVCDIEIDQDFKHFPPLLNVKATATNDMKYRRINNTWTVNPIKCLYIYLSAMILMY